MSAAIAAGATMHAGVRVMEVSRVGGEAVVETTAGVIRAKCVVCVSGAIVLERVFV